MSNEDPRIEETRRRREPPKMVNMDPSYNIPNSITQKESFEEEVRKVAGKNPEEKLADAPQNQLHRRKPNFLDPEEFGRTPLVKEGQQHPSTVTSVPPMFPELTQPIATQEKLKRGEACLPEQNIRDVAPEAAEVEPTKIEAPAEFAEVETEINDPNNYTLDHTRDEPLENEFTDDPDAENAEISMPENDVPPSEEIIPPSETTRGNFTVLSDDEPAVTPDTPQDSVSDPEIEEEETAVIENESATHSTQEIEIKDDDKRNISDDEQSIVKDVPDNLPEGSYVSGITEEEAIVKMIMDENEFNKRVPVASSPKELNHAELTEILDYTTTHYRIMQGRTREQMLKNPVHVESGKIAILTHKETPDFELRRLSAEHGLSDGERRVQVVCTQSGYSVICKPMNSRELRTFGRDTRSQVTDSYNTNMAQAAAIYHKLSEFSCGALTFEEFISKTAFPDLQTCIFGVYMATYPLANNFNLTCAYCGKDFTVSINNDTMICLPTGSTTQEMIQEVLNGRKDPKTLIESSKRWNGIDIFLDGYTRFFRIRTPSIAEFFDKAYRGKREDVIEENQADMYYAGYVRGYGILDIERYNRTGEVTYLYDDRIETIDREIANLSPDDKRVFENKILDYINKYSVSYQIPRVKCPHCNKIMTQKEINMKTLFFEAKAQKGL